MFLQKGIRFKRRYLPDLRMCFLCLCLFVEATFFQPGKPGECLGQDITVSCRQTSIR